MWRQLLLFNLVKMVTLNTALITAAEAGHGKMVKRLLDSDADLNILNSMGWTALMRVAANGFIYTIYSPSQKRNCSIDQKQIFPNIQFIISF